MTTPTVNVNPALLLEAAKLAHPQRKWKAKADEVLSPWAWSSSKVGYFNPRQSNQDAYALMLALMEEKNGGWLFLKAEGRYRASSIRLGQNPLNESFPLLLLACVSAQTGIPLS